MVKNFKINENKLIKNMKASEAKQVNSISNKIGVNSFKLGGLHIIKIFTKSKKNKKKTKSIKTLF